MWAPRPRSHSLNSADPRWHQRTVRFLISDSEEEDGYHEDNEASSAKDPPHFSIMSRERPRSAAPKVPLSRVKDTQPGPSSSQKSSKKRHRSLGRKHSQTTPAPITPRQPRPSSAGPLVKNCRKVVVFLSQSMRKLFIISFLLLYNAIFVSIPPLTPGPEDRRLSGGFL